MSAAATNGIEPGEGLGTFSVLFVCTGNICRSPTAEALLRQRVEEAGGATSTAALTATSAGVATEDGWRIDRTIAVLLEKRGLPGMRDFRSRALTGDLLEQADLVLTGTRDHRLRIGRLWPEAYPKTFTLRESASLLAGMPAAVADSLPDRLPKRAHAVVRWLQDERGLVATPESELDIADPIGRRTSVYRRMVDDVSAAIDVLANVLLPG